MSTDAIVFLGPTLVKEQAQTILPDATYLPPVACGDVLRALRLKPKRILIIDGLFERTPAVWHKEILYAMESGVEVYGASSMGALRAAELAAFGMQGIGEIYTFFASGELTDDDEVAVLHAPAEQDFILLSEPMVNVRATVANAIKDNIIVQQEATEILAKMKGVFYGERRFSILEQEHNNFFHWQQQGGYVDQKKLDAITALNVLANSAKSESKAEKLEQANKTLYLRTLSKSIRCDSLSYADSLLSEEEQCIKDLMQDSSCYKAIKKLAFFLSAINGLSDVEDSEYSDIFHCIKRFPVALQDRYKKVCARIIALEKLAPQDMCSRQYYFETALKFNECYTKDESYTHYFSNDELNDAALKTLDSSIGRLFRLYYIIARIWRALDIAIAKQNLTPNTKYVQKYSNIFRRQNDLVTKDTTQRWLDANDMTLQDYHRAIMSVTQSRYLVMKNHLEVLGAIDDDMQSNWIYEAMLYFSERLGLTQSDEVQGKSERK